MIIVIMLLNQECLAKKPETCSLLECQKIVGEYNLKLTEIVLLEEIKKIDEDCNSEEECLEEIVSLTGKLQKNTNN